MSIKIGDVVYVTKSYVAKEVMRINLEDSCFLATDWTLWNFSDIVYLKEVDNEMEEDKILDFILKSKWYDYRKAVKNQELNVYGMEMSGSLSDEIYIAVAYIKSIINKSTLNLQRFTILKLDLYKLQEEFLNKNVNYKLEPIKEPYQTREQMISGWYE